MYKVLLKIIDSIKCMMMGNMKNAHWVAGKSK